MKINHRLQLSAIALAAACIGLGSCTEYKKGEYADGSATIACEEGFQKVLEEEIEVFEYQYPNAAIIPYWVSETAALDSVLEGKTKGAILTQELTKDQIEYIKKQHRQLARQQCIAVDAVALITNKDNPVEQVSLQDVGDIMLGKVSKWNQLMRNDTANIKLVFDNAGSSTVRYMKEKFLPQGAKMSDNPNAFAQNTNADVFDIVKKDKNAIGIISVSWLGSYLENAKKVPMEQKMEYYKNDQDTISNELTTEVNILKISNPTEANDFSPKGYKPYQAYIFGGEYPLVRKIYFVSLGANSTVMHSFYTFVTGFVGQKIIATTGIAPYHYSSRVVNIVN